MELGITWCEDGIHCYCKERRMDRCIEEGEDACESCTTLIGRDAVASMSMYKAENADIKLIVKKHKEEIARLRKRVPKLA